MNQSSAPPQGTATPTLKVWIVRALVVAALIVAAIIGATLFVAVLITAVVLLPVMWLVGLIRGRPTPTRPAGPWPEDTYADEGGPGAPPGGGTSDNNQRVNVRVRGPGSTLGQG